MVSLDEAVIARIIKGNEKFEILVDPEKALELRKGKSIDVESILATFDVFKDAKLAERASEESLVRNFGKKDIYEIAKEIILNGEIQITVEQRRKLIEQRRKEIATLISRQVIDPRTKLPHPQQRILNAMEKAKINIDPFKSAHEQMPLVIEKIREILPISIEKLEIAAKIPIEYAGKISAEIRRFVNLKKEEWQADYYYALFEIPAGIQSEIFGKINSITHGNANLKIVREINV